MDDPASALQAAIEDGTAMIGIIGLGYVGLPLIDAFAIAGFHTMGFDIDQKKVDRLLAGESYIGHISASRIAELTGSGQLIPTTDMARLAEADVIIICVPTPLSESRDPDLTYVEATATTIAEYLRPGQLVVLESTTYPGTTEEVLAPRMAASGLELGKDYYLAFSPERIDPGNPTFRLENTPKVLGGMTPECTRVAAALYGAIVDEVHEMSSPAAAELVKLLENTFRSVNIGLANEMALMCDRMGIDTWEVIRAASTKPFGFMPFFPGPGLGGHCIPVDPLYLTWKARTLDYRARLVETAAEINAGMPEYVVEKVAGALNEHEKSVRGSRILMIGVAYKRDIDDTRESPAIDVMRLLQDRGARVEYADPWVPRLTSAQGVVADQESVEGLPAVCSEYDCVVVGTDHSSIDWPGVIEAAQLVVDTRNVADGLTAPNVVRI